jgi:hypothetical protein
MQRQFGIVRLFPRLFGVPPSLSEFWKSSSQLFKIWMDQIIQAINYRYIINAIISMANPIATAITGSSSLSIHILEEVQEQKHTGGHLSQP